MSGHNSDDESNQNLPAQDSSDEVEVSVASTGMLALELGSSQGSVDSTRGSTISTAGTDMTPNYTSMSISPEHTSGGSGNTIDSRIESIGSTPLDEPNLIEAILKRQASADSKIPEGPRPDPEGALDPEALPSGSAGSATVPIGDQKTSAPMQVLLPTDVGADLKRDPGTMDAVVSGSQLEVEDVCSKIPEERTLEPKLPPVPSGLLQVPATGDRQLPPVLSGVPQGQSSAEDAEGSRAGSSDRVDYDESCISPSECSRDSETDDVEADVSNISAMSLENRRKVFRRRKPQPKLADVVAEFFQPPPPVIHVDPASRADTLDDAEALRLDSESVRSSIPERGASVLFPPEVSYPTPPDRARRAISLPAGPVEKAPGVSHDARRAISEAPDDSRVESERPPLSASPDDVPLPSPLVSSSSSSSSRHVSDVDLNACGKVGSEEKGGPSDPLTDPSLESREVKAIMTGSQDLRRGDNVPSDSQASDPSASESSERSSDVAQLQGLQGWMNQGERHPGPPRVPNIPQEAERGQASALSDSSITGSSEVAQLQALQGWMNQGERQLSPPNIPPEAERSRVVLSDSSSTRSSEEAQFQALKGCVSQGRGQGERPLAIENQPSPSGVTADPNIQDVERREASLPNIPERDVQVDVRPLREFDKLIARGAFADKRLTGKGKTSTSGQQPKSSVVRGNVEESHGSVEKGVQTETERAVNLQVEEESRLSPMPVVPQPRSSESVKGQPEVSKAPKRKRLVKKEPQRQPSEEQESVDSSDQPSNVEVSPEEGLATKKYCSEFSRPVLARRISRSHSTGSVKDEHRHRRKFREWQESSTKESPEREKMEEEYSSSKKPKEDDEDEKDNA